MFMGGEHKFNDHEHMFKGGEHRFTKREYKICDATACLTYGCVCSVHLINSIHLASISMSWNYRNSEPSRLFGQGEIKRKYLGIKQEY